MTQGALQRRLIAVRMASIPQIIVTGLLVAASAAGPSFGVLAASYETGEDVSVLITEDSLIEPLQTRSASVGDLPTDSFPPQDGSFSAADCTTCGSTSGHGCTTACDPPGIFQLFGKIHDHGNACWVGRADALILWRNAPPARPLVESSTTGAPLLNANGLDSTAAAGPRISVIRFDKCTGHGIEATYLRAANFRSQRPLPLNSAYQYALAPPGIYSDTPAQPFDSGNVNLGSRIQSFELNRLLAHGPNIRWIAGFRWVEWQEEFTLTDSVSTLGINDIYNTNCFNDMYGGQIGLDANLLRARWLRLDSLIKAGAYYNTAVQSSSYATTDPANPGTASTAVAGEPASCAFVGELGVTGVIPITSCIDFRIGYFGMWLSGIAQPTQQLSGQSLTPGQPIAGTLNTNGGVIVQGVSLGLEGRW